ncbi:MAG: hypothetical protein IEMM0002_0301 [bacterium]|nr:MAG: hypothetical protein IEMM0002_0301 [bacterium]
MAGYFSKTAYNRLPAAVRKLPEPAQTACIFLRLRKTEDKIADEMGLSQHETALLVNEVKRTLMTSGNYDLIADPVFVPFDAVGNTVGAASGAAAGDGGGYEPAALEESPEDRVLLENFISALKSAISTLAPAEKRILHLFFERQMTGAQILDFYGKCGLTLDPERKSATQKQPDVFYFIDKTLKKLVSQMADSTPIGRGTLTVKGLKEILDQTGLKEAV